MSVLFDGLVIHIVYIRRWRKVKMFYRNYAYYYDLFYRDKDYRGEAECIKRILSDNGVKSGKILSFGCGTGKYECELADLGYEVHGIDLSEHMIELAKKKYLGKDHISFEIADIRNYRSEDMYDAVISLFCVMSYQTSNEDMIAALKSAQSCLKSGGVFLFDVWYGPGVLSDLPRVRVKRYFDGDDYITRIAEPVIDSKKNIVDVNYEIIVENKLVFNETHRMRYWFRPEVENFMNNTGITLIDNYASDFSVADFSSWTSYFIAKK